MYIKFIYSEKATKFLRNLHQLFDWQYIWQMIGGDITKFFGLLRIYELYLLGLFSWKVNIAKKPIIVMGL